MYGKMNLTGPIPLPLFGNMLSLFNLNATQIKLVKKYGKTILFFEGTTPVVWTADPELVKIITIRDFKHFTSRRVSFSIIKGNT